MSSAFIIIITILASAFFSGMEIAYLSANKLKIEIDRQQGFFPNKIIGVFHSNPGQYIATILLGNNLALVIYGIFMAKALTPFIESYIYSEVWIMLIQTLIATLIILMFAEFLPKAIVRINPNQVLTFMAVPLIVFYVFFYPASKFLKWLSGVILKYIMKQESVNEYDKIVFGKVDLDYLINDSQLRAGSKVNNDRDDIILFQNALDFVNVRVRDCMTPRTEIVAAEVNDTVDELRLKFVDTGFSKLPVYEENIDNVVGYVTSKDLFKKPDFIKSQLKSISFVTETMSANKLLRSFIQEHKSMAIVVDEFGGISGLLTIEDIIEEIFGEIDDEHDIDEFIEKKVEDNLYIFSGRLEIDYLNSTYDLEIPESDEYDTLAGFITYNHGNIPSVNDVIAIEKYEIKILKLSHARIELVKLKLNS